MTLWGNMHASFLLGLVLLVPFSNEAALRCGQQRVATAAKWTGFGLNGLERRDSAANAFCDAVDFSMRGRFINCACAEDALGQIARARAVEEMRAFAPGEDNRERRGPKSPQARLGPAAMSAIRSLWDGKRALGTPYSTSSIMNTRASKRAGRRNRL
jgi:hypothetical protein